MKEQVFISLVLYVSNNEDVIYTSLKRIFNFLNERFDKFEIIIVNDASKDKTKVEVKRFIEENDLSNLTLINMSTRYGLETSIFVGIDFSIGDFVIELDSPLLYFDEKTIYTLYEKSCEGFDIVSLKLKRNRNIGSSMFYFFLNKFSNKNIEYESELCYILSRRAINSISKIKDKIKYRKILHNFTGFRKGFVTIDLNKKIKSSATPSERIKMASDILFSFTNLGQKINIYITVFFLTVSILLGAYAVYQYLFNSKVIEGWTTMMLFMSFGFSGVFMVLSIINKYFSIILKEIHTLPTYTILSIDKN
ncbi:MAG: glycosyltransferase [Candidatus Cloacimonetes bacterium]|nr:glycosyltransferase [Candidatus Cloacimonadota bacterium]